MKEIKLRADDARKRDVGMGIARIDSQSMKELGIMAGDPIDIVGKKTGVAIAWPAYSEDQDRGIVKIDSYTRRNAGIAINQYVVLRPSKVEEAQRIVLAPIDMRLNVDEDFAAFVKNRLMERVFREGNTTVTMMLGRSIPFSVVRTNPSDVSVRMTYDTVVNILNEPYSLPRPKLEIETPADIRYLMRFDWLNSLATRIKATKIVFLIPDTDISDTNEQKVLEAARKIADQDISEVRIAVRFERDEKIVGTLPWAEIDIYGAVSAAYPDVQLPPPSPSLVSQGPRGRIVPPMKRCFKTSVSKCPKEVNFSPRSIVIAMPFRDEFNDVYKYGVRPALEETGFEPWKADEQISNIDIMCKICQAIQESGYVLANITTWNPNVVFELGLAYGLGRNVILIKHKKSEVPVDLKGLEYIEYGTIEQLKRNLLLFLKGITAMS